MAAQPILIQMSDVRWTKSAVYTACQHAQSVGTELINEIVLVKFLSSNYLNWQGAEANEYHFSESDQEELAEYRAIAAHFGIPLREITWKYDDLEAAIIAAADGLHAESIFVNLPHGLFPMLHHREVIHLDHELKMHHHQMISLDQPAVPDHPEEGIADRETT